MTERFADEGFLYTELSGGGHDLPKKTIQEMFDFLADQVRWEGEGKRLAPTAGPLSSFLAPVTREEVQYLRGADE